MRASVIHSHIPGRQVRPLALSQADVTERVTRELAALGIGLPDRFVREAMDGLTVAMDDLQGAVLPGSITTPTQFLQAWLPGFVRTVTTARKIDQLVGITTVGRWEDEEIVAGLLEETGLAVPYGDYTNIPLASFQAGWERRTIVRFEQGMRVGRLEEARAAAAKINAAATKRNAAAMALDIQRNRVGFYGFNGGNNRTYGLLNDPGLPAYVTVANGAASSPLWANKTWLEITKDIRVAIGALVAKAQGNIDPKRDALTLVLPLASDIYMGVTSDYGNSVQDWLNKTYPNLRIETAPELTAANGGANVFYLYVERVEDGSDDGGRTFEQFVPTKFQTLGTERGAKHYVEDYTNALGGVMVKRPWAIVRYTGI